MRCRRLSGKLATFVAWANRASLAVKMSFTVAVGDIHGMADKLRRLLLEIDSWLASVNSARLVQFIFLGDYIDRGLDSKGVIETVRAMQNGGAICLRGNVKLND